MVIFPVVLVDVVAVNTRSPVATVSTRLTICAEKLPVPSRSTIVFGVFVEIAVVAEFATLFAVEIVASLVSTIPAAAATSAFTINELDNNPDILLCTTPAVANGVTVSEELTTPSVRLIAPAEKPPDAVRLTIAFAVLALTALVTTVAPCGPVTSPDNDPEKFTAVVAVVALPFKAAVIVPAEKFPAPSRNTIVFDVFVGVAVVAELATFPAVEIVASLVTTIAAPGATSAFTINELDNNPDALL